MISFITKLIASTSILLTLTIPSNASEENKDCIYNAPLEMGDLVYFSFEGSIDGKKFIGGTGSIRFILGKGNFIPGFEEKMVGWTSGQKGSIDVKFPDDYGTQELAGKLASFALEIFEVHKKQPMNIKAKLPKKCFQE